MELPKENDEIIVIIDDEPSILKSLKWELEIAPVTKEMGVVTFENTSDAIEFIMKNSGNIFLVIADLRMPPPNMFGSDLLLYIHELFPDIILFLLTAYSDISEIQKAITAKIQALIFKPWTSSLLIADIVKAQSLYRIRRENRELNERLQFQLQCAGEFQKKLLAPTEFVSDKLNVDIGYVPLSDYHCGGDYYDFLKINENKIAVFLGDVAGHGIKPALVTAMLKIISLTVIKKDSDFTAGEFLFKINKKLCEALNCVDDLLVTFTVLILDFEKEVLNVAGAGSLPVYLLNSKGVRCLNFTEPAIGVFNDIIYNEQIEKLGSKDEIVVFTDGLIELADKGSLIEDAEVSKILGNIPVSPHPAEDILAKFRAYHKESKFTDDVTVITLNIE